MEEEEEEAVTPEMQEIIDRSADLIDRLESLK
jgi:hypothetical protein